MALATHRDRRNELFDTTKCTKGLEDVRMLKLRKAEDISTRIMLAACVFLEIASHITGECSMERTTTQRATFGWASY